MLTTPLLMGQLVSLVLLAGPAPLAELVGPDRRPLREPVYESETPLYCLLVFGPQAETRVWLVLDGDVLYIDRNGNGDLTDPGERIEARYAYYRPEVRPEMEYQRFFSLSTEQAPVLSCVPIVKGMIVTQLQPRDEYRDDPHWGRFWERPFRVSLWGQDSRMAFTERPEDAPVVWFLGPVEAILEEDFSADQFRGGEPSQLSARMITPGIDSTVRTSFARIKGPYAVADIEFPPRRPGGAPIRRRVELREHG